VSWFPLIVGTDRAEQLKGTNGAEEIRGLGGADEIVDGRGRDVVYGGGDVDNLIGYGGDTSVDRFSGRGGNDTVQSRDVPAVGDAVAAGRAPTRSTPAKPTPSPATARGSRPGKQRPGFRGGAGQGAPTAGLRERPLPPTRSQVHRPRRGGLPGGLPYRERAQHGTARQTHGTPALLQVRSWARAGDRAGRRPHA
jgi:Ca2+-binding RTX toxin-like protein